MVPTVTADAAAVTVPLPPREMLVPLTVTEEFVRELFPIFDRVLPEPLIVLLVNVSVVARPTSVSVEVGRVSVPVLTMLLKDGVVNVGLVARTLLPVPVLASSPTVPALSYNTLPDVPPLTVVVLTVRLLDTVDQVGALDPLL